jgi:hypothetical protein
LSKRLVAAALLVPLLPYLTACHKRVSVAPAEMKEPSQERIVELTTTDGRVITFERPGASLRNGVVSGSGSSTTPYEIPESQVTRRERNRDGITSVTTADGKEIRFEAPGATVRNGIICGQVKALHQIPLDQVQRVWVERTDAGKTALATIGILAGVFGVVLVIAAATKESCPFVYSWDGTKYVFDAEPYGGATTRGLERDDYSELEHLRAEGGHYRLMVTNEVQETQYTNLLELWVVDHPPTLRVVADEWGGLHTLADARPPSSAQDRDGRNLVHWLERTDKVIWEPEAVPDAAGSLRREIVMSFPKPKPGTSAKLVANVATSLWGSFMIKEMLALRGRELGSWYASIDRDPAAAEALLAWNLREELFALKIEVEEPTGWEVRGALLGGGPFVAEDRVVPLDLSGVTGDHVRIRIRPPAGFWALNSFALDSSPDQDLSVEKLLPVYARDARGAEVLGALRATDDRYYEMPVPGDRAYVSFPAPAPRPGTQRTVFLHSRGYYRLHLPEGGEPDRATLRQIVDDPDGAARFSAERFARWQGERHRTE